MMTYEDEYDLVAATVLGRTDSLSPRSSSLVGSPIRRYRYGAALELGPARDEEGSDHVPRRQSQVHAVRGHGRVHQFASDRRPSVEGRGLALHHGQAYCIPDDSAVVRLAGHWTAPGSVWSTQWPGRRHQSHAAELDVFAFSYDYSGRFIEGAVDSAHPWAEREDCEGRVYTTAEHRPTSVLVHLDNVSPNVQSVFFVVSSSVGAIRPEHAPGVVLSTAERHSDGAQLASYYPDMRRLETVDEYADSSIQVCNRCSLGSAYGSSALTRVWPSTPLRSSCAGSGGPHRRKLRATPC